MRIREHSSKSIVWLVSAVIVASLGLKSKAAGQTVTSAQPIYIGSRKSDSELPFVLRDGYLIVVEGRIGRKRRVRLAVDTGATYSVLRSDIASGHVFTHRTIRVVNLDRVVTQEGVDVADFQLGPIRVPHLLMMTSALSYLAEADPDLDGIVGLDVLRQSNFTIDFGRGRIVFGATPAFRSSVAMEDQSYLAVDIQMLKRPVRLVLDTGVRCILLYRDRMGDRLPDLRIEQRIRGTSFSGSASLDVVTLPPLELNGTALQRKAVLLRNSPQGFLPELDGYFSVVSLGARRLSFDFEKKMFSWE